jgi:hypothetical protein
MGIKLGYELKNAYIVRMRDDAYFHKVARNLMEEG